MVGKLDFSVLEATVFRRLGARRRDVVVGPGVGIDAAVIEFPGGYLVVHSDPITEAKSRVGWLAVNVAANDVAVAGAEPRWASITILLPEGFERRVLEEIVEEIHEAASRLGIAVVGGHTEEAPRLDRPIVVATVMGVASRILSPRNIEPGDLVVVAKNVGAEGASIVVSDFPELVESLPEAVKRDIARLAQDISVVKEALAIRDYVKCMHDPTEGGILGALYELAYASGTIIEVEEDKIPIPEAVKLVAKTVGLNPLKLMSSGALIAVVGEDDAATVVEELRSMGVEANVVGRVKGKGRPRVAVKKVSGGTEVVEGFVEDEIAKLWARLG